MLPITVRQQSSSCPACVAVVMYALHDFLAAMYPGGFELADMSLSPAEDPDAARPKGNVSASKSGLASKNPPVKPVTAASALDELNNIMVRWRYIGSRCFRGTDICMQIDDDDATSAVFGSPKKQSKSSFGFLGFAGKKKTPEPIEETVAPVPTKPGVREGWLQKKNHGAGIGGNWVRRLGQLFFRLLMAF
jgi:hypothetical protein